MTSTYKKSGVNIAAGNQFVEAIKPLVKKTHRPEVIGGIGGFSGAFKLLSNNYQNPVLVAATDGVGTKLKLAIDHQRHSTIGIDLVAMCINDLIVCGAEPLFFLDYYATAKLDIDVAKEVVKGIAEGCQQAGCALLGGETAEMPGMYQPSDYDLAGFAVGVVEQDKMIDGSSISSGDVIIGLPSSGIHSNGYSLVRNVIETQQVNTDELLQGIPLIDRLLQPTKIYVQALKEVINGEYIKGLAHITGGGIIENLTRILPDNCDISIDKNAWEIPPMFTYLQSIGNIPENEMWQVFNLGIGMIAIIDSKNTSKVMDLLTPENPIIIGEIITKNPPT